MKRIVFGCILVLSIVGTLFFGIKHNDVDMNATDNRVKNALDVSFSEEFLGEKQLIQKSDAIVYGKIVELIDNKTEKIIPKEKGIASINWTYSVYTLQINDCILGDLPNNVYIVFAGNKPEDIETDKEYVLFLERDVLSKDSYHLLSYNEGVFEIKGDNFENQKTKVKFNKESLTEKVKKIRN